MSVKENVISEWRCSECNQRGQVEHWIHTHGYWLQRALSESHRNISPNCRVSDPALHPGPLSRNHWPQFVEGLKFQVDGIAAQVKRGFPTDRTALACTKNEIVFLDIQLGTDGESVSIGKQIESLRRELATACS